MDCIWVNLKNVGPPFLRIYGMPVYTCIKMEFTQLEIILSCYVTIMLQMKDSWSANLTFRVHN